MPQKIFPPTSIPTRVGKNVPNRIFVDTLFVVALINPRDQYHAKAAELAARYEDHLMLVTDAVLLEIGNGLARDYKQEAIEVIEYFYDSEESRGCFLNPRTVPNGVWSL